MNDKSKHFLLSVLICFAVVLMAKFMHPVWVGVITTIGIGFGKEYLDEFVYKTGADEHDIIADIFGIIVALVILDGVFKILGLTL